ncbi:MAG: type II 3-dehydroquinate dehydratase [Zoogloeaceae bacterium]|jgi:3-dehydroquinate dehydratase-2|nr:type II 3-dehydroquinate dehydratase [Zoogloeaceae bacterium]
MNTRKASSSSTAEQDGRPLILVLHGPNLNLLGLREPQHYGRATLEEINESLMRRARTADVRLLCFQSNHEGECLERIHAAKEDGVTAIIINPAAWTHTSVALRDALLAVAIPFIEVHLSNVYARETFRRRSFFSDAAVGVITGLGAQGYLFALEFFLEQPDAG